MSTPPSYTDDAEPAPLLQSFSDDAAMLEASYLFAADSDDDNMPDTAWAASRASAAERVLEPLPAPSSKRTRRGNPAHTDYAAAAVAPAPSRQLPPVAASSASAAAAAASSDSLPVKSAYHHVSVTRSASVLKKTGGKRFRAKPPSQIMNLLKINHPTVPRTPDFVLEREAAMHIDHCFHICGLERPNAAALAAESSRASPESVASFEGAAAAASPMVLSAPSFSADLLQAPILDVGLDDAHTIAALAARRAHDAARIAALTEELRSTKAAVQESQGTLSCVREILSHHPTLQQQMSMAIFKHAVAKASEEGLPKMDEDSGECPLMKSLRGCLSKLALPVVDCPQAKKLIAEANAANAASAGAAAGGGGGGGGEGAASASASTPPPETEHPCIGEGLRVLTACGGRGKAGR